MNANHKTIKENNNLIVVVIIFGLLAFLVAATRVLGDSPDYFGYDEFFDLLRIDGFDAVLGSRFEIGFTLLSFFLINLIPYNSIVYGLIALGAVFLKLFSIKTQNLYKGKLFFALIIIFYFSRYYPLHELTQLRAACAISLVMVAAVFIWRGNFLYGIIFCLLAFTFHKSVAVVIPAIFLPSFKRWHIPIVALCVFFLTKEIVSFLIDYFGGFIKILEAYQTEGFGSVKPNPLSIQLIIEWISLLIAMSIWPKSTPLMQRVVMLESIGIAIFYGAMEFAVVAHRMREFYSVFWVFYLLDGVLQRKTRMASLFIVVMSLIFYTYIFYISGNFFSCGDKCSFQ